MEPVTMALMGASLGSSLMGMFGGDDGSEYLDRAMQELIKVKIPNPYEQQLALERFRSAGELTPELERSIKADPSSFEKIVQKQKYAQAQDRALSQLQSLGEQGGMNLSDKADLQEQMIANATKDRGNRDAITDEMARRGQLGSGMSLQAQLQGQQASGDRDAQMRLRTLADARDRSLKAIAGAGDLAGQMGQQDYQRQSDLASARDRINQFNTQNAQNVMQRNVASRNAAQGANLEAKQNMMNANTEMANREQQYNKELIQKRFENQMSQAQAKANVYSGQAQSAQNAGQRRQQMWGAIGSGLGQLGSATQSQSNWDKWFDKVKDKPDVMGGWGSGPGKVYV